MAQSRITLHPDEVTKIKRMYIDPEQHHAIRDLIGLYIDEGLTLADVARYLRTPQSSMISYLNIKICKNNHPILGKNILMHQGYPRCRTCNNKRKRALQREYRKSKNIPL